MCIFKYCRGLMLLLDVKQLMWVQISSTLETFIYSINILKLSCQLLKKVTRLATCNSKNIVQGAKPLAFKRRNRLNVHRSTIN